MIGGTLQIVLGQEWQELFYGTLVHAVAVYHGVNPIEHFEH